MKADIGLEEQKKSTENLGSSWDSNPGPSKC